MGEKICCFTGYRPHRFAFSPEGLRPEQVMKVIDEQVRRLYDEGYRHFISGMCVGVDMWGAASVAELKKEHPEVRLIAAVPFDGQETHWPIPARREYTRLLGQADEVAVLHTPEEAAKDPAECYRDRNRWMVDRAELVLAVYELGSADLRSGTAATVRYARRLLKQVRYIHPTTLQVSEEVIYQVHFPMD